MKPAKFDYVAPTTLGDALHVLKDNVDDAQIIAGGQSLAPLLNLRMAAPRLLIDLNHIDRLSGFVPEDGGGIRAGAMVRHREFELSPLIAATLPLVYAAVPHIAHVAIRNRGTIGGSLCLADPSAEWPALCIACDARIVLESTRGSRIIRCEDFAKGPYSTLREPDEILTEVIFPAWPETRRFSFEEVSRREGDFAIVGISTAIDLDADGRIADARIVAFGVGGGAVLLPRLGELLRGNRPSPELVAGAAQEAPTGLDVGMDIHASAEYRRRLIKALTRRTLASAFGLQLEQIGS